MTDGNLVFLPNTTLSGPIKKALSLGFSGLTDPFLNFSFSATNPLNVPDTFGITFNVPITACPAGSLVTSSISYSLTPGTGPDMISPVSGSFIGDPLVNGVSAGIPVGPTETATGTTATQFGPPTAGFTSSFVSGVAVNQLGFTLLFNLSGGLSQAGITGRVDCTAPNAVPEPGALALLVGGGMPLGLLAVRRLRRRASQPVCVAFWKPCPCFCRAFRTFRQIFFPTLLFLPGFSDDACVGPFSRPNQMIAFAEPRRFSAENTMGRLTFVGSVGIEIEHFDLYLSNWSRFRFQPLRKAQIYVTVRCD